MKLAKKIISVMAAGAAMMSMGMTALAAPVSEATIDTARTASLTVYKYDITAAEKDGVWNQNDYKSTGVYDQTVNDTLGSSSKENKLPNGDTSYGYAVKGVEFTYLRVADISTYSKSKIGLVYGFEADGSGEQMLSAIGLSWDNRLKAADKTVGGKKMYYFESDTLINALSSAVAANATTVKDALEAYVAACGGTAMTQTDSYGKTSAKDLPLGLYLMVETKVPEYITTTTTPFFVSLPMTSINGTNATDGGTRWMYDVTVYPKNQSGMPTLEKTVREAKQDTVGILHHDEGVDLVPANLELSAMEFNLVNAMSRETALRNYLSEVKDKYDYTAAAPAGDLNSITNTIAQAVTYVQVIGAGIIVLMLAIAGYHFFAGGQQGFELGKKKVIGILIGAALLFCATALGAVIKSMYGYTG